MPDGSAVGIMYYQKKKNKVFEKIFMPYSNSNNAQFSFLFFSPYNISSNMERSLTMRLVRVDIYNTVSKNYEYLSLDPA